MHRKVRLPKSTQLSTLQPRQIGTGSNKLVLGGEGIEGEYVWAGCKVQVVASYQYAKHIIQQ